MSQAQAPSPAPVPRAAPVPAPPGVATPATRVEMRARLAGRPTGTTEDVPRLLTRWQAIAVATCVAFGVLAALFQLLAWQATGRAADNTEQLVRVQQIQSSLFRADALATNAFLIGGLEPAEQRAEYDAALDMVLRQITDAAEAQPADREALAALNTEVSAYATTNAQARDNNRQGFPVGAEYLKGASAGLRTDAVRILQSLVRANTERADTELDGQNTLPLFLTGAVAILLLWWVNRQVARRFRRAINKGLAVAALMILVVTLFGTFISAQRSGDNDDLRAGDFALALDEASARTAANDAKANESLRLIARGSGDVYESAWTTAADKAGGASSPETLPLWEAYVARHEEVVSLDEAGSWDDAVAEATTTEAGGSSQALDEFDSASQQVIDDAASRTTDSLRSGAFTALMLVSVSLLVGLAAAGAATWGIAQRRREYA